MFKLFLLALITGATLFAEVGTINPPMPKPFTPPTPATTTKPPTSQAPATTYTSKPPTDLFNPWEAINNLIAQSTTPECIGFLRYCMEKLTIPDAGERLHECFAEDYRSNYQCQKLIEAFQGILGK